MATVALAKRSFAVEAIDAVGSMIELTRENVVKAGVENRVNANVGDIYSLGFPDQAFGLVLSMGVIPWLENPSAAITELSRILQPGGYLLFTADNRLRLSIWLDPLKCPALEHARRGVNKLLGRSSQADSKNQVRSHLHSIQKVDTFLMNAGLQRVQSETLGFGPFTLFHRTFMPEKLGMLAHRSLQRLADLRIPLVRSAGAQFLIMAKKPARS